MAKIVKKIVKKVTKIVKKQSSTKKVVKTPVKTKVVTKANGITKNSTFVEILNKCPEAGEILFRYGMHCIGCHMSAMESLEEGARMHGLNDKQIDELVEEINKAIKK